MENKKDAIASYKRNSKIVNALIDIHDGDSALIVVDIVMMLSLVVGKVPSREVGEELCDFTIESAEYMKKSI